MNVSTAPRVHMFISARLSCLESSTTQIYTISYQSKSLRGILWSIFPFSHYGNTVHAYICAVLSYIYKAVLAIPSTPNYS